MQQASIVERLTTPAKLLPITVAVALLTLALTAGAVRDSQADPTGDETVMVLFTPTGQPIESDALCRDPSIDIVSVAGSGDSGALSVSIHMAADVLSPQLTCGTLPVAVDDQFYWVTVGRHEDGNLLRLDVSESGSCLFVYFTSPFAISDCMGEVRIQGNEIRFEAPISGQAPMFDGTTRAYALAGPAEVEVLAYESASVQAGFWTIWSLFISDYAGEGFAVPLEG